MIRKRTLEVGMVVAGGLVLAGLAMYNLKAATVMPLDEKTLERFQQANSQAASQRISENSGLTQNEITALSFQEAVKEIGFNPEKTILYWISPEFQTEVRAGDPAKMTDVLRLTDSLLGVALGDGSPDEEFERIIGRYSPAVQEAARKRRGG